MGRNEVNQPDQFLPDHPDNIDNTIEKRSSIKNDLPDMESDKKTYSRRKVSLTFPMLRIFRDRNLFISHRWMPLVILPFLQQMKKAMKYLTWMNKHQEGH